MNENLHTINYTITFYSPWHCGSGLSAGADVDALVVKDENGIAKDHSLRSEEVVVPCTLYASITGVPENIYEILTNSFGLIKRLGQKRNRGLGRCDIKEGGAL